jgi:cytochrome c5
MLARTGLIAVAILLSAAACGGGDEEHGEPTGATCPEGSTLTYESFGAQFMEDYCTRCHDSALTGEDRNGAPLDHDFDTLAGVLAVADHIDEYAAAGPNAVNTLMPPRAPSPSEEQRRQLGEWLACELARQ